MRPCWDHNQFVGRRLWLWQDSHEHSDACDTKKRLEGRKNACLGIIKYMSDGKKSLQQLKRERMEREKKRKRKKEKRKSNEKSAKRKRKDCTSS